MRKIFINNRFIAITSSYESCFSTLGSVAYMLHSLNDIPHVSKHLLANKEPANLYIYTGDFSEEAVFEKFSSEYTAVIAGGGLVRSLKNEVLMIYRFSHWDLPKGKHEADETIEQTAVREVEEECGLSELELGAFITKTYHVYTQNNIRFLKETHWFELLYKKEEQPIPQQEEGIEAVKWVSADMLPSYLAKTYSSVKEVFKAVGIYCNNNK